MNPSGSPWPMRGVVAGLGLLFLALAAGAPALAQARLEATALLVDSDNKGSTWSDGVERGVRAALARHPVKLLVFHMRANTRQSAGELRKIGLAVKAVVDVRRPDVVIAAGDAAQKYFVVPHLANSTMPIVFCGLSWDISSYGYPAPNVTGMVETESAPQLAALFRHDAKGERIGFLSGATASDERSARGINDVYFSGEMRVYLVKDFAAFKDAFLRVQQEVDMLFVHNCAGVAGWDDAAAADFLAANTRIPTGSHLERMSPFVVYTMGNSPEELGEFAGQAALQILEGTPPSAIPIRSNEQVKLVVNLRMARAAGVSPPLGLLKTARIIGQEYLRP